MLPHSVPNEEHREGDLEDLTQRLPSWVTLKSASAPPAKGRLLGVQEFILIGPEDLDTNRFPLKILLEDPLWCFPLSLERPPSRKTWIHTIAAQGDCDLRSVWPSCVLPRSVCRSALLRSRAGAELGRVAGPTNCCREGGRYVAVAQKTGTEMEP